MGRWKSKGPVMPGHGGIEAAINGQMPGGARSARNYKSVPILGQLDRSGMTKEKEWSQEQFEDTCFADYLEHANRPSPGQTCMEKKGATADNAKCDFACFVDCQIRTVDWRIEQIEKEFKEGLFSKEEGKQMFALFKTTRDKLTMVQKNPGAPGNRHIQRKAEQAIAAQAQAALEAEKKGE